MKKIRVILIVTAILSAVLMTGCIKSKPIDNPVFTTTQNGVKVIDEDTAKRAAAQHINLTADDVIYTRCALTRDDGRLEYEIEFIYDGYEYEFDVDANDGRITDFDKDRADRDDLPISIN